MNDNNEIITLETFKDFVSASFVKRQLDENGIESFIEDENIVGLNPIGGVELKIFEKDLEKVKEILS